MNYQELAKLIFGINLYTSISEIYQRTTRDSCSTNDWQSQVKEAMRDWYVLRIMIIDN